MKDSPFESEAFLEIHDVYWARIAGKARKWKKKTKARMFEMARKWQVFRRDGKKFLLSDAPKRKSDSPLSL